MEISIVYPTYNEEENLRKTVVRSVEALTPRFEDFEIIIVNDKSTDRTGELAEDLAKEFPQVVVHHNPENLGAGGALFNGLVMARFPLMLHNGMDYPFDLDDLDKMIPFLDSYDVIVASRTGYAGYTKYRRVVSFINRMLLRTLFRMPVRDCNFVQLYKREVVLKSLPESRAGGFIVPEILIRARSQGFRIVEVPIIYRRREGGISVVGRPRVLWESLRDMIKFWLTFILLRKQDTVHHPSETKEKEQA